MDGVYPKVIDTKILTNFIIVQISLIVFSKVLLEHRNDHPLSPFVYSGDSY